MWELSLNHLKGHLAIGDETGETGLNPLTSHLATGDKTENLSPIIYIFRDKS